ncbi:HlyD family secretion protein [Pseudofulvibacter geojedonensis]|uniref:HlyD family secretion protein n=1 Tax=Pseudofulvibacter geojedonensis TaxID=1123758 RepID=A0ABW3I4P9_9FLAO
MLNISNNKVKNKNLNDFSAFRKVNKKSSIKYFNRFLIGFFIMFLIILFLPWTQNVDGKGYVTALKPDQRPQTIQSPIPGKIEKWYVKEGDYVKKGDTILYISEIKTEYQDPELVSRTNEQTYAKERSVVSYKDKIGALTNRINALQNEKQLKLRQAINKIDQFKFKVSADSVDLEAAKTNYEIAKNQFKRTEILKEEGLKSQTDLEAKKLKMQQTEAKKIAQNNKLLSSKNQLINAEIDISRIEAEYRDKIAKAQSEKASAGSSQFEAEAAVAKLKNQSASYKVRTGMYYVRAPQAGYINKALRAGIGETFKEGDKLVSIMPANYELAVETYIDPIDLPLIHKGENVRVQFDGWPAIFFSGWPNTAYGTFSGKVVVIDNFISENGKFRILIAPDHVDKWPDKLRVGSGAYTMALLEDVPIWFELWRKLNGFPPNYYQPNKSKDESDKK